MRRGDSIAAPHFFAQSAPPERQTRNSPPSEDCRSIGSIAAADGDKDEPRSRFVALTVTPICQRLGAACRGSAQT
jgi:hypothetical protein